MGRLLIQFPGTTTAKALTETLSKNVIIVDEDLHQLRLHDGSTAGGHLIGGSSGSGVPVGTIIPFAGNSVPQGYLLCDGSAISRTTYASLFAVIGTIYGAGDGNSTFNLPKRPNIELIQCTAYTSGNWYLWYRRYSNGFVQQGGVYNGTLINANDGTSWITFPIAFSNANYSLTFAPQYSNSMNGKWFADSHDASGFQFHTYSLAGNFRVNPFWWEASGYSSSPNPGNNKIIKYT